MVLILIQINDIVVLYCAVFYGILLVLVGCQELGVVATVSSSRRETRAPVRSYVRLGAQSLFQDHKNNETTTKAATATATATGTATATATAAIHFFPIEFQLSAVQWSRAEMQIYTIRVPVLQKIEDRRKKEEDTRQSETKMTGSCSCFQFEWMTDDGFAFPML